MTRNALLSLLLVATAATHPANAQLEEALGGIFDIFGGDDEVDHNSTGTDDDDNVLGGIIDFFTGDDEVGGNATDDDSISAGLHSMFEALDELIAEGLGSLNETLPDEISELFDFEAFDNFTFDFGGNCIICDVAGAMDGNIDGLLCNDWEVVAYLGITQGSDQCNLLRVAAVENCGCPLPLSYEGKTCDVCPPGQAPEATSKALHETLAVSCTDLVSAAAVDGDATCASISTLSDQCNCTAYHGSEMDDISDSESEEMSSARSIQRSVLFLSVVGLLVGILL